MFFKTIDNKTYKGYLIEKNKNEYNKVSYYIPKLYIGFNKYNDIKNYIDKVVLSGNNNLNKREVD